MLLLEIEPPFDKRDVQLARRRMAKRWHPDVAPPEGSFEHERHLKAINEAADQLERRRRGLARRARLRTRRARERAGGAQGARGRRPARLRSRAARARSTPASAPSTTPSAAAFPTTRWCTATRAASPTPSGVSARSRASTSPSHPAAQAATPTADGNGKVAEEQSAAVGAREIQPRRAHRPRRQHAVRRLLQTRPRRRARRALPHRGPACDGRRRVRAGRTAASSTPRDSRAPQCRRAAADDARLLAGRQARRGRSRRARPGRRSSAAGPRHSRFAARIYEDMGAVDLAAEAAERAAKRWPARRGAPGSAWGGCAWRWPTARARCARSSARLRWAPARRCAR